MMKILALLFVSTLGSMAGLVERVVEYKDGDTVLEGVHVYDDAVEGRRPAVLIIHQWMGVSENEKMRARMLAKLGYNVLAADIYGKGIRPSDFDSAGKQAGLFKGDRALFRSRLNAGLATLKSDDRTDTGRVAAIGYCFGGTGVLELARSGASLAGVVSFHGGLGAADGMEAKQGSVPTPILVCHGAVDPFVPKAELDGFLAEMNESGADYQFVAYSGAVHSFTQKEAGHEPEKGFAYHALADRRSWQAMKTFLAECFAK